MFKTFAAAALAAIASAAADGNGYDNLVATELIPGKLLLHIYNKANGDIDELHGELAWTDKSAMPFYREMGFCVRKKGDTKVDCMTAKFAVDPAAIEADAAEAAAFELTDGFAADFDQTITADPSADTRNDDSKNWLLAGAPKTKKVGCTASGSDAVCELALAHWQRQFETSEATQDIQLDADKADAKYEVWGWRHTYTADDYTTGKANHAVTETPIEVSLVFQAYLDAQIENSGENEDNENKDGATSVTTFAATLIAAMYALAF